MILEMLEWCVTPCPWFARTKGFLAAQIAIRYRARRCRVAWKPHLESCRNFVAKSVGAEAALENLIILGSGHLNDLDLPFLLQRFQKITLVDAVHPLEIQFRARMSRDHLDLVSADLSKPSSVINDLVSSASCTISSCVLSQLPLFSDENPHRLFEAHITLLKKSRRALLIVDVAKRRKGPWESLLDRYPLPRPAAEWIWKIAPSGESGPDTEERLVQAFVMEKAG